MNSQIKDISARQILDSRGNPTIEVEVVLNSGDIGISSVPSGASKGVFEAIELRDNKENFCGKSVEKAVNNVNKIIAPALIGKKSTNQCLIDKIMIELDNSENKGILGANAILGVSLACAKASSKYLNIPLYKYLGGINARTLPIPMINILNGGGHSNNNLEFQEFMIFPLGATSFSCAIQIGAEIFYKLKSILQKLNLSTSVGDEGGFAPNLDTNSDAIELILEAIESAGYSTNDIKICLDVASSEFYKDGQYFIRGYGYTNNEFVEILDGLVSKYPIYSIEDGMSQDDWEGWSLLSSRLGKCCQLVGDDLFVTNIDRIKRGINKSVANAVLIKPNQIGTLTETLKAIDYAKRHNYQTIISHRSGETTDTFIADLAVGVNSGQIKVGSLSRGERIAKYNRLLKIEQELGCLADWGLN